VICFNNKNNSPVRSFVVVVVVGAEVDNIPADWGRNTLLEVVVVVVVDRIPFAAVLGSSLPVEAGYRRNRDLAGRDACRGGLEEADLRSRLVGDGRRRRRVVRLLLVFGTFWFFLCLEIDASR